MLYGDNHAVTLGIVYNIFFDRFKYGRDTVIFFTPVLIYQFYFADLQLYVCFYHLKRFAIPSIFQLSSYI